LVAMLNEGSDLDTRIYRNTGTALEPSYVEMPDWEDGLKSVSQGAPKILDLDSDGDLDIMADKYDGIWYFKNIGDFSAPKWKWFDNNPGSENPLADVVKFPDGMAATEFADFDNDGDKDFLINTASEGEFFLYENQNPAPTITSNVKDPIQWI